MSENTEKTIKVKMDKPHIEILDSLIPFYGKDCNEVIRNISIRWMEENIGTEKIRKLTEIGAIRGISACQ